ncbi:hypothetical protein [Pantoea stewartii]|uniref:Holin n=1 Tax=Pantoea stewartii subsp. stewartii DC283 TaxID=660596 RepID=H3R9R7_PANSE|nr:hypothetical protein [Pantoea stewartii]ARF51379.1 hypothetical protein DSJ_20020 [Pantoea stewartii subsp. stewartii DC283]EHU01930.1 hypothetical protein CKS_0399 [Pantoea stewartii subsp. stewartii DC283]
MELISLDTLQTLFFGLVASGLTYWVKSLHTAIDELRKENIRMRELYQLKSDAVRDQEQIMAMLSEIKQSMERTTERIDRLIGSGGH